MASPSPFLRNVDSLLRRLVSGMTDVMEQCEKRGMVRRNADLFLWIDQICIDQRNPMEKAIQIKLMGEIYSSAAAVVADFGDDNCLNVLALLGTAKFFVGKKKKMKTPQAVEDSVESIETTMEKAMRKYFTHRIFTRSWILQEFVLNHTMLFLLGEHVLPMDQFTRNILSALGRWVEWRDPTDNLFADDESGLPLPVSGYSCMTGLRGQRWDETRRVGMKCSEVVRLACSLSATIEHDKIYGCLALVDEELRQSFRSDYTESVQSLGCRVVRAIISHERRVDIRYQATFASSDSNTSSWSLHLSPESSDFRAADALLGLQTAREFNVSADRLQSSLAESQPNVLLLRGYHVDQITHVKPDFSHYGSEYRMTVGFYDMLAAERNPYRDTDAFWRTLCQNRQHPSASQGTLEGAMKDAAQNGIRRGHSLRPMNDTCYLSWLAVEQGKTKLLPYSSSKVGNRTHGSLIC